MRHQLVSCTFASSVSHRSTWSVIFMSCIFSSVIFSAPVQFLAHFNAVLSLLQSIRLLFKCLNVSSIEYSNPLFRTNPTALLGRHQEMSGNQLHEDYPKIAKLVFRRDTVFGNVQRRSQATGQTQTNSFS